MALFSPSKQQGCSHITPGATRSGFRISNVRKLGPLDENAATIGEGRMPNFVPKKARVAVGRGLVRAYCLIIFPAVAPTAIAGTRWLSATSSSPFSAVLANIMPLPCILHYLPFMYSRTDASVTYHNLPSHNSWIHGSLKTHGGWSETPDNVLLLPSFTTDGKSLSIVLAPTVVIHGDTFMRVIGSGPPFPAEQETNTPFSIAPKVATAKLSWLYSMLHSCKGLTAESPHLLFLLFRCYVIPNMFRILLLKDPDCVDAISETQEPAITFHVNPIPIPIPRLSDPLKNCEREILKALTSLAEMVPREVKKSNTIQNVRTEFSKLEGISMVKIKKSPFVGDWLQNEQMVVDYDIKNGSIISVFLDSGFRTKIHIKMLQIGKPITLDVDMRDTVLTIKSRGSENKEGISLANKSFST
ncbi:hypothetical protein IFM89_006170 [Coptis chinensis]|uniref:Uncharacterized protein n=1 Tax=Coptis chinensis TaxID=261450 RepID=A0A835GW50_9MAGN|nr:hypothetical protein IFM89_006170 [Coptis chinensis]